MTEHFTTIFISGVVSVANTTRVLELSDRYVFEYLAAIKYILGHMKYGHYSVQS
jgi:hypothetical protein